MKLLVDAKASHFPNQSGNTPLHWAVQNKQADVVKLLVKRYENIDVLAKNSFGKGALTHAFQAGDPDILAILLAHPSAKEDKILDKKAVQTLQKLQTATHELRLREGAPTIRVRELAILEPVVQSVLGKTGAAHEDKTGLSIWGTSIVLSRWLAEQSETLRGKTVLELGAGCGLGGLTTVILCGAKGVCMTDVNSKTLDNLRHNINLNQAALGSSRVMAAALDWTDKKTWAPLLKAWGKFDVIVGSDLVYDKSVVSPFVDVVDGLMKPKGRFLYATPTQRAGRSDLSGALMKRGFSVVSLGKAGDTYRTNPAVGRSEEEAKAIFCDLAGKGSDIQLWHFAKGTTIESGTKSSVDDGEQESSKSVQTKPSGQPKTSA